MILQRLAEHYDRLVASGEARLPPPGYSLQKVSFCIVLEADGTLHSFEDMRRQEGRQMRPRAMLVPGQGKPSGSGFTPCFLWDSPEYLLGISLDPAKAERASKAFAAFRAAHSEMEPTFAHPAFSAVCAFLRGWTPEGAEPHKAALAEYATNFGVFRLRGEQKYVHELVAKPALVGADVAAAAMCLVSGEHAPPARLHEPKIKGVNGAQTSGALLVSFNAAAFTSYGKDQSFNAPVSLAAVFKYSNALNHLLGTRERRVNLGDSTVVYWADRVSHESRATLGAMDALLGGFADDRDEPAEDRERLDEARLLLTHFREGTAYAQREPDGIPTRFFLLGLSPNASRLSVRLWVEAEAPELTRRLGEHVRDLQLVGARDDRPLSLWRMVTATGRWDPKTARFDAKAVSPQLAGELARSVLTGAPYPQSLLAAMVRRIRADREVEFTRVSAIKAVLVRKARLRGTPLEVPVQLDPTLPNPAYRCGQLFALLEKAQTDSLGSNLNSTIKDRFFASASATPALVFPRLFRLNNHHLAKLGHGGRIYYGKLMANAMREPFAFPRQLTLEEQGLFIVGYFQQQRDLYTKKENPAPEEQVHE